MFAMVDTIVNVLKGTILHPQWLTDRFHIRSRRLLREIKQSLIVDIGSGNSQYGDMLESSNRLYRLDYPQTNQRYRGSPDIYGDACNLPFKTGSLDIVFLFEVLEHIASDGQALREIHRVLRTGGKIYASVPFVYPVHDAPYDYRRYTIHGLRLLLDEAGFVCHKEVQHGNSFITVLQMLNLAMLETVRDVINKRGRLLGLILGILVYPLCITVNLVGLPLTYITSKNASCFGHFIVAECK
jgi:SAM-dependent methyltransferase